MTKELVIFNIPGEPSYRIQALGYDGFPGEDARVGKNKKLHNLTVYTVGTYNTELDFNSRRYAIQVAKEFDPSAKITTTKY
jgi:hypothetical protein